VEKTWSFEEVVRVRGSIPVWHRYTAGAAARSLAALKERGEFVGSRCPECDLVYWPARAFCERCFSSVTEEASLGPGAVLLARTVVHVGLDGSRLEEPVRVGLIALEGADGVLVWRLAPGAYEPGQPLRPVLRPPAERTGSLEDILYFEAEEAGEEHA
jgi:uncharacterized OB-fold protein